MTPRTGRRVGVVSQWYPPEPATIPGDLVSHLVADGSEVVVLTGFPNYPSGAVYPGYSQSWRHRERGDGVIVVRAPLYLSHDASGFRRMLNYVSFAVSGALKAHHLRQCDVIYVYSTPVTAAIPALVAKLLWRVPVVMHVQDLWPESVTESGMIRGSIARVATPLISAGSRWVYRRADALVGIAPRMTKSLVARTRGRVPVATVLNWSDVARSVPVEPGPDRVTAVYAGNLGAVQDLERVVDAVESCDTDVTVRFVGDGVLATQLQNRSEASRRVVVEPPVGREEMGRVYASADFSLVTLRDAEIFRGTVPSKLQASVAAGVPVITNVGGDVADMVERADCGLVAVPGDTSSLAEVFATAANLPPQRLDELRANARRAAEELFDRDSRVGEIMEVLDAARRRKR